MGYNSLHDIQLALKAGACAKTYPGFHQRNTEVAKAGILIAFTWSTEGYPVDGGTADTWKKCKSSRKIHVNLNDLVKESVDPDKSLSTKRPREVDHEVKRKRQRT